MIVYTHDSAQRHDTGDGHPERADRIREVWRALEQSSFAAIDRRAAPLADADQLARVHRRDYVDLLLDNVPREGHVRLDADTVMSPDSGEAALRASGAMVAAVDAIMAGEDRRAFCAVRPPGHHAEAERGMGFCLFNNVAVGVAHARAAHGLKKVAVVDFDVHHGNGTQHMFERDPSVMFASTHEYPLYPGTGAASETGVGNVFNAPLSPGSGSAEFRKAMERTILPALRDFAPEMLFISAGFDAHARDPLATLRFDDEDYRWVTARLVEIAEEKCDGRVISTLEGGYDLQALYNSVTAHLTELMRN